ncbi:MAG: VCBS repeat-containing protein, partial [Gammaproteobacteria bacterium]
GPEDFARSTPVSIFRVDGDPLNGATWRELELGRYSVPQNSEPVDLDGDGDMDIVIGTRGENRLLWFENPGDGSLDFIEHAIGINGGNAAGFNLEYADLNGDGRLDIIDRVSGRLGWLEQPAHIDDAWNAHLIGTLAPDSVTGLETADIDGDGRIDILVGSYSRGDREDDGSVTVNDPLGRIAWFQQPAAVNEPWLRHDITRRKRGMFDKFVARDIDQDGDMDFIGTRGNSFPFDGVFWLEQVRSAEPTRRFQPARERDSQEMALPTN